MNNRLLFIFFPILLALLFIAGCDMNRSNESDIILRIALHRDQTGPFIGGKFETITLVILNGSYPGNDSSVVWTAWIRQTSSSLWIPYDSVVSLRSTSSFLFLVPDSLQSTHCMQIRCDVTSGNHTATAAYEAPITAYQPSQHPIYYGSSASCNQCHSSFVTAWRNTLHNKSIAHRYTFSTTPNCYSCHSTGYDTSLVNGGSDENYSGRMDGVQCEACHGPSEFYGVNGNAHTPANGFISGLTISSNRCLECHDPVLTFGHYGSSNPRTHNFNLPHIRSVIDSSSDRDRCAGCHLTSEAIKRLDGDSVSHWATSGTGESGIGCIVCHSAHHRSSNPYKMLRTTPDRLCQVCHQSGIDLPPSINKIPLHPQADMLANNVTAIIPLTNTTFPASGAHSGLQGSCAICHLYATPWLTGTNPVGDHSFQVLSTACTSCHPGAGTSFISDSQALFHQRLDSLNVRVDRAQARGDTTQAALEANWIRCFLNLDRSYSIHNPRLANALLDAGLSRVPAVP